MLIDTSIPHIIILLLGEHDSFKVLFHFRYIPREVLMPLTSLNPGNSRGLATRAKLVEAVLLKVALLKNSDLPHSSRIL